MKTHYILLNICLIICSFASVQAQQLVNYNSSTAIIANPYRGLQKYTITNAKYSTQNNYSNLNETELKNWRTGNEKVTVIYRHFMLDAFFNTDISATYLTNIQKDFDIIRNAGLKCLVRFAYSDAQNSNPQQPTKSQILSHIQQLSSVLSNNKDIIMSFQAGFIGTWGEWYYTNSSEFGTDGNINSTQWSNRKQIIEAMLAAVPEEIFIQVRYPVIKTTMYGSSKLNATTAFTNSSNARIGFFNDAFLNNWGDMGTFNVDTESENPVSNSDYQYLSNESRFTLMTGETNGLNNPRTNGSNAIFELDSANWTCLNRDYHIDVWNMWINSGNYNEILKRLGYRFVLNSSEINTDNQLLTIKLSLENQGFTNLLEAKKAYLILQHTTNNTDYKFELSSRPRNWSKKVNITETFDISSIPNGEYRSFLYIPDHHPSLASRPEYAVQFANDNMWQAASGYNALSQIITKTNLTTSIQTPDHMASNVLVYPNPAHEMFTILNQKDDDIFLIEITDLSGKKVLTTHVKNNDSINIKHLNPGVYTITLLNNNIILQTKLLKQ